MPPLGSPRPLRPILSRRSAGAAPPALAAALLPLALLAPFAPADASLAEAVSETLVSGAVDLEYWAGLETDGDGIALSRVSVEPALEFRLDRAWSAELALRGDFADDDTGLGTVDTFSPLARPFVDGRQARVGIERATLSWRQRRNRVTLGKQTIAWGVLDGLQVTDRYDPVRRRDAVLGEVRPERIARWGARWRTEWRDTRLDFALTLDPSVSQLARRGDVFEVTAPRYTVGLGAGAGADDGAELGITGRDEWGGDATYGLRATRRWSGSELSVLAFSGPDPEPVLALDRSSTTPVPVRDHPRRTLFGTTYERSAGAFVFRAELAHVPDQPVNVRAEDPRDGLEIVTEARTLLGVNMDWNAPGGLFLNAQLAADLIAGDADRRFRPERETVGTLRLDRGFANERWRLKGEWIASLEDGDGVVRPQLDWQRSDNVFVLFGADLFYGDADGAFGQFSDTDRVWVKVKVFR